VDFWLLSLGSVIRPEMVSTVRRRLVFGRMFDEWRDTICGHRTLHRLDRPVLVDVSRTFPAIATGAPRRDELPMWVKSGGLHLTPPWMPARQIAWIRRANDGAWLAVVLIPVTSANAQSRLTMQLWLETDMLIADEDGNSRF
jgi:hypothetical protein